MKSTALFLRISLVLSSLALSSCTNRMSDEFVRSLDQEYYSQWPKALADSKYPAHSLGTGIMPYFREHARACGVFEGLSGGFREDRDFIPTEIQHYTGTPLQTPVSVIPGVMGENVFYYGFTELNSKTPQAQLNPDPLFKTDELGLARTFGLSREYPVVPEVADSWRIRQTCSGYLNSHLAASFDGQQGVPFIPLGAFKSAVKNDKELKSSIVGVAGTFVSPLASLLSTDAIHPDAINVKLNLWYAYRERAARGQLENFLSQTQLLKQFKGLLISRATDTGNNNELNANGVMTVDLNLLGKLEGKLDAKYSVKNTFNSIVYNTLIYCQPGQGQQPCAYTAMPLPEPEQLVNSFQRINPDGGKDIFSTLQPGRPLKFWQDVAGIPEKYCNKNEDRWAVNFSKNGDLLASEVPPLLTPIPLPTDKDGVQRCRFQIESKVKNSTDKRFKDHENLELAFELVSKDTLALKDKAYQLKIPGKVSFSTRSPIQAILVGKEPVAYEKVGNDPRKMSLKWEFDLIFREEKQGEQIINYQRLSTAKGENTELIRFLENQLEKVTDDRIVVSAKPDADGREFYHVTVYSSKKFDFSNPAGLFDDQYTLKTELQVPLKNNSTQSVPLEFRLAYPVVLKDSETPTDKPWYQFF